MDFNKITMRIAEDETISHLHTSDDDHPAVYVGTYAKYNEGNLDGDWIDLTTFASKDEFLKWCEETLHGDEPDPELMYQDYENFPSSYYEESHLSGELWDYIDAIKKYDKKMVDAVIEDGHNLEDLDGAHNYPNCYDMKDVVLQLCDEIGFEAFTRETWESVFDYERYGRDCRLGMDSETREEYEGMSDKELGEEFVNAFGGIEGLEADDLENYADLEQLGMLLKQDGGWVKYDGGYVQIVEAE